MPVTRKNCIVLDTSVLPKRPSIADIKQFLDGALKLDMTMVKSIQTNIVRNVVYLVMHGEEAAATIASSHHLKHFMCFEGKPVTIPLPIYIDSSAVDVRLHDLPEEIDNQTITHHMQQYGEVISIRNDVWKSYFPGLSNGVRILRMKPTKPIPSYITISDEITYVSHFSQVKTCRTCGAKEHPKLRCSEAATSTGAAQPTQPRKLNNNQNSSTLTEKQWPALPKPEASKQKNKSKRQTNDNQTKRQLSIDSDSTSANEPKRAAPSISVSSESDSNEAAFDVPIVPVRAGYRRCSFSHIDDPDLRQQYIAEETQRIEELYKQGYNI